METNFEPRDTCRSTRVFIKKEIHIVIYKLGCDVLINCMIYSFHILKMKGSVWLKG